MTSPGVAVVTGAARGIGFAIAGRLADRGHQVLMTDLDGAAAQAAADRVGRGAWGATQDVSDQASHRVIADEAASRGQVKVWVNNAGILFPGDPWDHTDEQRQAIVDVNFRGVLAGSAAGINVMKHHGGGLLNVASISALTPVPGLALYAATKAAVLSFTTSLQGDLDHAGIAIRARAICPDVVGTAMVHERAHDKDAAMLFSGPKPLTPEQIAEAGLDLLDSKQIFRVVPRWRGALVRSVDLAPSAGLKSLAVMRKLGERRQRRS